MYIDLLAGFNGITFYLTLMGYYLYNHRNTNEYIVGEYVFRELAN